jgi:Protein of unknown function (DUF2924)
MDAALKQEIESLRKLKTKELRARYFEIFGEVSPSQNHAHVFRRVAWRLQARAEGGLSDRARQRARELADDANVRLRAPRAFWTEVERKETPKRDPRLPPSGAVLERTYRGKAIQVRVGDVEFEYNGRSYLSLSAIAHKITGTRWNGFAFFGLKGTFRNG